MPIPEISHVGRYNRHLVNVGGSYSIACGNRYLIQHVYATGNGKCKQRYRAIYATISASGGSNTISFAVSSSSFQGTSCTEFLPYWTLTTDGSGYAASSSPITTTPTMTTTLNDDLIYSHDGDTSNLDHMTVLAPDIQASQKNLSDSQAVAVKFAGAPGPYTSQFSQGATFTGVVLTVAFQPISGIVMRSPTALPDGVLSTAYNYTLQASGGVGSYTWSITSGSLQPGLSLNASTGAITGTPTAGPQNTITFHVTDGTNSANLTTTLKVSASQNTISLVQSKSGAVNGGGSLTFTSNVTSGNLITVREENFNGPPGLGFVGCTDTLNTPFQYFIFISNRALARRSLVD